MSERIIPLADAPAPNPENLERDTPATQPAQDAPFAPEPLNTLKFKPLLVEAVSKVFDPEIPVNIYELGLVYDLDVDSAANVHVRMTLTAPACPAAQTIPIDVERRVREVPGVNDVKVSVVWDPPWTRDRMSDAAKLTLGMY
jgi:FeS assembly SUF system protein